MSDDYTDQERAIAIAPKFTSLMSMFGSGYIVWDVLRNKKTKESTQHRLLLGMSICDFIVSATFFLTTWPIPEGTDVYGASGNQGTCTAQGFFSQFSLAVAMYNAALSLFYVAKVRWNWTSRRITNQLEPFLHMVPLLIGMGTSLAGVFLELYNNDSWECWIAPLPHDCNESFENGGVSDCIRGDNASLYRWTLYYVLLWLAIAIVTINMFLVYFAVLSKEKAMDRYVFNATTPHPEAEITESEAPPIVATFETETAGPKAFFNDETNDNSNHAQDSELKNNTSAPTNTANTSTSRNQIGNNTTGSNNNQQQGLNRRQSKRVAKQGYWYCGAFYSTWFFPTITRLVQVIPPGRTPYPLILTTAMFVPVQGFFNFLVYAHPNWVERRKDLLGKFTRSSNNSRRTSQSQTARNDDHRPQ